jgi:hypothetical protein
MDARRTHCPAGRPLYRGGELPDHLATETMLGRQRRRLAAGQLPVASLLYAGNKHAPLYEVRAAVPLPALSTKRAAAYEAARTCVRCGSREDRPLGLTDDGRRLCAADHRRERLAECGPSWLALRMEATAWARGILADPNTVILAAHQEWLNHPLELRAITTAGMVLVDAVVWPWRPAPALTRPAAAVDAAQAAAEIAELAGCRFVHYLGGGRGGWADQRTPLAVLAEEIRTSGHVDYATRVQSLPELHDEGDYQLRYNDWLSRPLNGYRWPGRHGLALLPISASSASELAGLIATGLREMADDTHPDGAPACPVLPPAGQNPCGRSDVTAAGCCPDHEPLAADPARRGNR